MKATTTSPVENRNVYVDLGDVRIAVHHGWITPELASFMVMRPGDPKRFNFPVTPSDLRALAELCVRSADAIEAEG